MNIERTELVLTTIDKLRVASVQQLHKILKLGSYRYTCKIIQDLEPYLVVQRLDRKIVYLNKEGRDFIGSNREVRKTALLEHSLLANDVFIHYNCPQSWQLEYAIEVDNGLSQDFSFIKIKGINISTKEKIVCDAIFTKNGYTHIIEIDNMRSMIDNKKKIKKYLELWPEIRRKFQNPKLCIFTKSEKRKKTFQEWIRNVPNEIYTFEQIK